MSWNCNKLNVLEDSLLILSLSQPSPKSLTEQTRKHDGWISLSKRTLLERDGPGLRSWETLRLISVS